MRNKIIQKAAAEVGTKESPPGSNRNPYGKWYGFDGYARCAMFVSWVYDKPAHRSGRSTTPKVTATASRPTTIGKPPGNSQTSPSTATLFFSTGTTMAAAIIQASSVTGSTPPKQNSVATKATRPSETTATVGLLCSGQTGNARR